MCVCPSFELLNEYNWGAELSGVKIVIDSENLWKSEPGQFSNDKRDFSFFFPRDCHKHWDWCKNAGDAQSRARDTSPRIHQMRFLSYNL